MSAKRRDTATVPTLRDLGIRAGENIVGVDRNDLFAR
jgi:hypothetical protein